MRSISGKLAIGIALTAVAMLGADNSLGAWKWNAAKSTLPVQSKNPPPLASRIDVLEAMPDGAIQVTRTEQRQDGSKRTFSYTFRYDGKEYPVTGGTFDLISAKRINATTTVSQTRNTANKLTQTTRNVISKDGKTKTSTITGSDGDGKPVNLVYVYEKQQ